MLVIPTRKEPVKNTTCVEILTDLQQRYSEECRKVASARTAVWNAVNQRSGNRQAYQRQELYRTMITALGEQDGKRQWAFYIRSLRAKVKSLREVLKYHRNRRNAWLATIKHIKRINRIPLRRFKV